MNNFLNSMNVSIYLYITTNIQLFKKVIIKEKGNGKNGVKKYTRLAQHVLATGGTPLFDEKRSREPPSSNKIVNVRATSVLFAPFRHMMMSPFGTKLLSEFYTSMLCVSIIERTSVHIKNVQ